MTYHVTGLVSEPTLFFSDDGVSLFTDPNEKWFISEVLDRLVSKDTKKVYSVELFGKNANINPGLRRMELSVRLQEIDDSGADSIDDKVLVYSK